MKFSIVIPVYKVEKYLRECVDSILSQSFKDYEVILVDDGSPDNCPKICDEYANSDTRVKVIHQENAGQACARNAAIRVASGEYILCLDSDDFYTDTNVLQNISQKIQNNPDVVIFGYKKLFESDGTFGGETTPSFRAGENIEKVLFSQLKDNSFGGQAWTKAVRRELLIDNNIEFRKGMVGEDTDWFLNILQYAQTFESLSMACVIYRQRTSSTSHAPKPSALTDFLWILETWTRRINDEIQNPDKKKILMSVLAYYYPNLMIIYSNSKKDFATKFKNRIKDLSYLFDYAESSRAQVVGKVYGLLGFDITILLLKMLLSIKKMK